MFITKNTNRLRLILKLYPGAGVQGNKSNGITARLRDEQIVIISKQKFVLFPQAFVPS